MTVDIEQLIATSGDSSIVAVSSLNGIVTVELDIDEFESTRLIVRASSFFTSLDPRGEPFNTGFLDLCELDGKVATENGYFVPPVALADVMKQTTQLFQLAWGKKTDECRYLLYFRGSRILFAAPIREPGDVSCEVAT